MSLGADRYFMFGYWTDDNRIFDVNDSIEEDADASKIKHVPKYVPSYNLYNLAKRGLHKVDEDDLDSIPF